MRATFPSYWRKRLHFAAGYALRHFGLSLLVALLSAGFVFLLLYPPPFQAMLAVGSIYFLVLAVDIVCGPLLTLVLSSPSKSMRARWVDFSLIGLVQLLALAYGIHSVWEARPSVLAFEVDRLVLVTANEVDVAALPHGPAGAQRLPWWGVLRVSTRKPAGGDEFLETLDRELAGQSPAMRPDFWLPWQDGVANMRSRVKPLTELMEMRPQDADALRAAARKAHAEPKDLVYLPFTSSKTREWVALLDSSMEMVGYAQVDGFVNRH